LIVEFTEGAVNQVQTATEWWRANRPYAPALFEHELAGALALLARGPLLAQVFANVEGKLVPRHRGSDRLMRQPGSLAPSGRRDTLYRASLGRDRA
jgi:hypothetical protein